MERQERGRKRKGKAEDERGRRGGMKSVWRRFCPFAGGFRGRKISGHFSSLFPRGGLVLGGARTGRKTWPGPLSAHVRPRRWISCLAGAAASYRGRFNFNLEAAQPGGNFAIPRFRGALSRGNAARLSHVRALQLLRVAAITAVPDRCRLYTGRK